MFYKCINFTGKGLDNWKPIKCKNMKFMFQSCKKFDCDLSDWNVSNVKDMRFMFDNCVSLKTRPHWYK